MKVIITIPDLRMGGAEKMSVTQAEGLARKGFDVTLLTVYKAQDFYTVPKGVKRLALNLHHARKNILGKIKSLRTLYKTFKEMKPDVVISNMMVNVAALSILLKIKTIFAEHMQLDKTDIGLQKKFVLNKAAYSVFLSGNDERYFKKHRFKSAPRVIQNPAVKLAPLTDKKPEFLKPGKNAVAVGRLVPEKGFDILIRAWKKVAKKHEDWHLSIVGDGPLKSNLEDLIKENKLDGSVTLAGQYKDIANVYKNADIFILSSRQEGFPLALCEAMAWGAPPVAFDCETGPSDIIKNNHSGVLLNEQTASELAGGINFLIEHEDKRAQFAKNAAEITKRLGLEEYINKYADLCRG
ncbi:MAG: glycosyltransferase family 4 protein [Elusimicrobia bacterium]|nr:glycosyltransferase family 4 protein [Elusimicrobiota bacterium]